MEKTPHLVFEYPDYIPDSFENEILGDLKKSKIYFHLAKKQPSVWASYEWIIPGLFSVYILKPYFEAFLKEAGKEHYNLLIKWLKKIAGKTKSIEVHTVGSSEGKVDKNNTQSKAFSIYFETKNSQLIKFLFDNKLEQEKWFNSIEEILNLAYDHHDRFPNDRLTLLMKGQKVYERKELYMVVDEPDYEWKFVDVDKLIRDRIKNGGNTSDLK